MPTTIRPENNTPNHDVNGVDLATLLEATEQRVAESANRIDLLTMRVRTIKESKVDAVANTRALRAVALPASDNAPAQAVIEVETGGNTLRMSIGDVAHDQFANKFKIDKRYYDRMKTDAPVLLAQNLNHWMINEPEDRLLRMLRPAALDEKTRREMASIGAALRLRGVLGKGYRTIDDADLVDAIVPTLVEQGASLVDFSIDDRRMHARFATEFFTMEQLRDLYARRYSLTPEQLMSHARVNGKDVSFVGEPMAYGVTIRHSEVGFASLAAAMFVLIAKCMNGMVGENAIAIRHVGGKNGGAEDGDVRYMSDATQMMENAALLGRVQDTIKQQMDPKRALERANEIVMAKVDVLARPEAPLFEFVGNIGLNLGLSEGTTELLKEETLRSIGVEGGETRFAFIQGITAVARQMTDYESRLDLERTGFALLQDDASALLKLGRDAEQQHKTAKARTN